jgi:hypothetical protein
LIEGLGELVDQEQRCGQYNNQNKKEDDPDSIGPVYLIVGRPTVREIASVFNVHVATTYRLAAT